MDLKVGIQLYSVRKAMSQNPMDTIEKVGEIGYKYIELANHDALNDTGCGFKIPAYKLKEKLDVLNMEVINCHVCSSDGTDLNEESIKALSEYHKEIGNNKLTLAIDFFKDLDDVYNKCSYYNRLGEWCKKYDMQFLYHNHFHEFSMHDGIYIYDIIMENTDPSLVGFELDTFWTLRGGVDPIEAIYKYKDRIKLLHQKDFSKTTSIPIPAYDILGDDFKNNINGKSVDNDIFNEIASPETFTEIGTGIMDIQKIIDALNQTKCCSYILLEQDYTKYDDEIESIKISMDAFKKYTDISWE